MTGFAGHFANGPARVPPGISLQKVAYCRSGLPDRASRAPDMGIMAPIDRGGRRLGGVFPLVRSFDIAQSSSGMACAGITNCASCHLASMSAGSIPGPASCREANASRSTFTTSGRPPWISTASGLTLK